MLKRTDSIQTPVASHTTCISSWSRPTNHVQREEDRPEYAALGAMHGEDNIVDRIFTSFLAASRAWQEGYRTRCWELLHRLNERPRLVALLASAPNSEDPLLDDLRHGAAELGIVPRNREEILWMRAIRDPEARAQWTEAIAAVADMSDLRRLELQLRDVPVAIAAKRHAPRRFDEAPLSPHDVDDPMLDRLQRTKDFVTSRLGSQLLYSLLYRYLNQVKSLLVKHFKMFRKVSV